MSSGLYQTMPSRFIALCSSKYVIFLALWEYANLHQWHHGHILVSKLTSLKNSFRNTISVSTTWNQIRTDMLSILTWVQAVCKGYQHRTKVVATSHWWAHSLASVIQTFQCLLFSCGWPTAGLEIAHVLRTGFSLHAIGMVSFTEFAKKLSNLLCIWAMKV